MRIIALTQGQKEDKGSIGLDFDGVIHRYSEGWKDGSIYDKPIQGTEEALSSLLDKGFKLFIFTARDNKDEIPNWLETHFKDERLYNIKVTDKKLPAQLYIDDRGLRFENWKKSLEFVNTL